MVEINIFIWEGWFYWDDMKQWVCSVDDVYDMYECFVGGNFIFLLNIFFNWEGWFFDEDVAVFEEVGKWIQ